MTISSGDRVAVVGINGSGKSTLLRLLTRAASPDDGRFASAAASASPRSTRTRAPPGTVAEYWVGPRCSGEGLAWEVAAVGDVARRATAVRRRTDELSGGQAKRVALAKALVGRARDLIVLDEPTNHLDLDAIEWLEARLVDLQGRRSCSSPTTATCSIGSRRGGRAGWSSSTAGRCSSTRGRRRSVLRDVPRGAGRAHRTRGRGGVDAPHPGPPGAGLAAPRRAGPVDEAQGAPRARGRDRRGGPAPVGRARERPRARRRHQPARQPGRRARRRGASASAT